MSLGGDPLSKCIGEILLLVAIELSFFNVSIFFIILYYCVHL